MIIKTIGDYRVELFERPDGAWNYRIYSIWSARTSPYTVPNACYRSRKDALDSAKDYISRKGNA